MFKRLRRVKNPRELLGWFMYRCCPCLMSDRLHLETLYLTWKHEHLNLDNPRTFNEKLQWLKLYDRNPIYIRLVDKHLVKKWVADKIGEEYIIPTLAVYKSAEEIDIAQLPEKFVLKCNHDSGSVKICNNKSTFDIAAIKDFYRQRLKYDPSKVCGEWVYKDVPRLIIAEQFMEETDNKDLMDYKWFCFDGVPRIMYMSRDHAEHATTDFFDMDFNRLPIRMQAPNSDVCPKKPDLFDKMRELASVLSQGIPQVRVDFYIINNQIYFGEMTFYHCGGMVKVQPEEWNVKMGDMIHLPRRS